jgi:hypothetical protein
LLSSARQTPLAPVLRRHLDRQLDAMDGIKSTMNKRRLVCANTSSNFAALRARLV